MKKILITGIAGFVGSHLSEHLLNQGKNEIFGLVIDNKNPNISHLENKLKLLQGNLLDYSKISKIIKEIKPDIVYHLAAKTVPWLSFSEPKETFEVNVFSQINLFEAILEARLNPRILIIGSADEYGVVKSKDLPVDEGVFLRPVNPYAVSKITQDYLGFAYHRAKKLQITRTRSFNHIGPRQNPDLAVSSFSKQIAHIEKGKQKPIIEVGNLDTKRDFTDVRDIVRAYILLVEKGIPGEVYNVGSGNSYPMKEILDVLLSLSKVKIRIEIDKSRFRPADVSEIYCDPKKLKKITGWQPQYSIEETLKNTLEWWRTQI